jgi:hypothetical protein
LAGPILFAILVFLFPLALYCLALAYLNRGPRPVMIPGVWDCIGLLFGLSGFLLWTMPSLVAISAARIMYYLPGAADPLAAGLWSQLIQAGYYTAVAVGAVLLLILRRSNTAIYNVETEHFGERLAVALADLGLDSIVEAGRYVIAPAEAFTAVSADAISAMPLPPGTAAKRLSAAPGGPRYVEVRIDTFAAFCHVTLHWDRYSPQMRRDIENQLGRTLQHAGAPDNPAAGWFLGFSGLVFGTVTMAAILFVVLIYLHRR